MKRQNQSIEIKNKLINHLIIKGKKNKSEKIVLESFKTLQLDSEKSSKKLFQLALLSNTPLFKINTITQKKRKKKKQKAKVIPAFISRKSDRISFALKFITKIAKKKNQSLFQNLSKEILLASQNKSQSIEIKQDTQKQAFLNRHLFKYYRWH